MGILLSVLLGALAGWLASRIMKVKELGLLLYILLGIVGGYAGGLVFDLLGLETSNLVGRLAMAVVGAVLIIVLVRAIKR